MARDLISAEVFEALYDYFGDLPGAHGQIRKFANAAGLIRSRSERADTSLGTPRRNTRAQRQEELREYLADVDLTSQWGILRIIRFCELVLESLEEDPVQFDAIAKPLERNGYVFDKKSGHLIPMSYADLLPVLESVTPREYLAVLNRHLQRIEKNLIKDPAAAVGSSKELIETVCKIILSNHRQTSQPDINFAQLFKETTACLNLSTLGLPTKDIKRFMNNVASIIQTVGQLRNSDGTGHGHTAPTRLEQRHARLVYSITAGICTFLIESDQLSPTDTQPLDLAANEVGKTNAQPLHLEADEPSQASAQSPSLSCTYCGASNPPYDYYCSSCGVPISCIHCGASNPPYDHNHSCSNCGALILCTQCGESNPPEPFCSNCGAPLLVSWLPHRHADGDKPQS